VRIAVAGFAHETVTFLPDETQIGHFEENATRGRALIEANQGTNTVIGGFLKVCAEEQVEAIGLVAAECSPSGPVREDAYDVYCNEIIDRLIGLKDKIDGLLIYLHGAMATLERQDPETDLLRRIREEVGVFPIAVGMDLHGNISKAMMAYADIVCGFRESPHIDMAETGERAARLLLRQIRTEIVPTIAFAKVDLVLPSIFTATSLSPLKEIMAAARELQRNNKSILDITIFTGFAYADVKDIGFSVIVITDGEQMQAYAAAEHLADRIESEKEALFDTEPVYQYPDAVARAYDHSASASRPIVLLEHADRMNDSTWCLQELMKRSGRKVAVPFLCDPITVKLALASGVGSNIFSAVGARSSLQAGLPVPLNGKVKFAGTMTYRTTGVMRQGYEVDLGNCAVLEANNITLILTSLNITALDTDPFRIFGFDPRDFDIILLRSKTHFRAAYTSLADEIIIADTPDWGTADLTRLDYRNSRPGVYPISARVIPIQAN